MPGCGKDELLAVARDLGFSIVRMGDVVREEAARRGLPITDEAVGGRGPAVRQGHGVRIWAGPPPPPLPGRHGLSCRRRGHADRAACPETRSGGPVVVAV